MTDEAKKGNLKRAALLTLPDYPESENIPGSDLYGNGHTARFLDYLGKVANERESMNVDAPHPHIMWKDMPVDDSTNRDDYNADIKDAPPSPSNRTAKPAPLSDKSHSRGNAGNFDSRGKTYRRAYTDGRDVKILKRETPSLRKEDK
jgi:hypothetical protein